MHKKAKKKKQKQKKMLVCWSLFAVEAHKLHTYACIHWPIAFIVNNKCVKPNFFKLHKLTYGILINMCIKNRLSCDWHASTFYSWCFLCARIHKTYLYMGMFVCDARSSLNNVALKYLLAIYLTSTN